MLKKEITYEDPFTEATVTETFYFHLTKAELIEWEVQTPGGGLKEHLEEIMRTESPADIQAFMKDMILRSYGRRVGGSGFIKKQEWRDEFESSEPYSELFWELCTNADTAAGFFNSIAPKALVDDTQQQLPIDRPNLTKVSKPRVLTRVELVEMDTDDLKAGLADGRYILDDDAAKV